MKIGITPLITENFAPSNVKGLAIFNGNKKMCDVDISKIQLPAIGEKLYSFGLLSDMHLIGNNSKNATRLNNALTYFEVQNAAFCCHCGDMTDTGFWKNSADTEIYLSQFAEYKHICELHPSVPVYGICGNHESYSKSIEENLTELAEYTGDGLTHVKTHGDDVFIFVGQSIGTRPMSDASLQWLYETLEAHRNERCFVYVHCYVSADDSGNPLGLHDQPLFGWWGATKTKAFVDMMAHYKNVIVMHGHSHVHFDTQQQAKNAIYTDKLGYRSLHVPPTANARRIIDGALGGKDSAYSLGYLVDVYENHIVLKGYDFIGNTEVLTAQYCIDMAAVEIPEKSFVDSTGTINTNQQ